MNKTNKRDNNLFEKLAEMVWVLHKYHEENHNQFEKVKNNHEKQAENRILAMLKLQEEMDKEELMYILDIPKYHFNKILDKMEKEENISFIGENDDIAIKITEKGKSKEEEEKTEFDSIFDCLTEEEKTNFFQYVDTIATSVKPKLNNEDSEYFDNFSKGDFHKKHSEHHRENRNFRGKDQNYDSHEYFGFFGKSGIENKNCGHKHGAQKHFNFRRHKDSGDYRRDRENDCHRFFR